MEQDFLLLLRQVVRCVGPVNILVHAAGRITEKEAFELLCWGRFVYRCVFEGLFVQLNVAGCSAEDGFDDFGAGPDGSTDLFCYKARPLQ